MRGHRYAGWCPLEPWLARHFGGPSPPPPPPEQKPPPKIEDKSVQEAAAKERAKLAKRRGRSDTMLSGDTLGVSGPLG